MRKLFAPIILLVFLGGLLLIWLQQTKPRPAGSTPDLVTGNRGDELAASEQGVLKPADEENAMQPSFVNTATGTTAFGHEEKVQSAATGKNVAIRFFGKVVDQDQQPLEGVRIKGYSRQWIYSEPTGVAAKYPRVEATTDDQGSFQISGANGDTLKIEKVEKPGYEVEAQSLRDFGYNISENHVPRAESPVVFTMWKKGTEQVLVTGDKFLPIIPDGRVYTMNLVQGTLSEGDADGDFRLSVWRAPSAAWGKAYDWSFMIEAKNGGFRTETDANASMFLAPESGYTNGLKTAFIAMGEEWSYTIAKRLYGRSGVPAHYWRMEIQVDAFYLKDKQARLKIGYALNPSGSRVLK